MRPITPGAAAIEVDYTHAPAECHVCTLNAKGELLDLIETFEGTGSGAKAQKLGARLACETGLPIKERREPYW